MNPTQRLFAVLVSLTTLLLVLELVRRRRFKEEYSLLWIATSSAMLLLSAWYGLIERVSRLIGAVTVTTTLFLFGLLFLLLISVHFTMVLSRLTQQVRRLTQELALHEAERAQPGMASGGEAPATDHRPSASL